MDGGISTDRVLLRPLPPAIAAQLPDDREAVARAVGARLTPDWPQPALLNILHRQVALTPEHAIWGIWMIIERGEGAVIGDIGFHGPPTDEGIVEAGFSVVAAYRRRGYASESAIALMEWARQQHAVTSIVAGCDPHNRASIATLKRAGFVRTGTSGEELRWKLAD